MSTPAGEKRIALAAVAGAHGIKGELRLKLFGDGLGTLKELKTVEVAGSPLRLLSVRVSGKGAVARFEGVSDRGAAESLRGSLIEIDRETLPSIEEDEYYHADLIGLPCVDGDGAPIGVVVAVENFGASDLLEIELPDGKKSLIPFKPGIADRVEERVILDRDFLA